MGWLGQVGAIAAVVAAWILLQAILRKAGVAT